MSDTYLWATREFLVITKLVLVWLKPFLLQDRNVLKRNHLETFHAKRLLLHTATFPTHVI